MKPDFPGSHGSSGQLTAAKVRSRFKGFEMLRPQAGFVSFRPDVSQVDRLPGQDAERYRIPNDGAGTGVFAAVYFENIIFMLQNDLLRHCCTYD